MEYGFKKGQKPCRPSKKVYVFTRVEYASVSEASKATGVPISNVNFFCKEERMSGNMVFSFNQELGQNFKAF